MLRSRGGTKPFLLDLPNVYFSFRGCELNGNIIKERQLSSSLNKTH